jgi:hypothetical protein
MAPQMHLLLLGLVLVIQRSAVAVAAADCTIDMCEGINLLDAIKRDLEPWRLVGC